MLINYLSNKEENQYDFDQSVLKPEIWSSLKNRLSEVSSASTLIHQIYEHTNNIINDIKIHQITSEETIISTEKDTSNIIDKCLEILKLCDDVFLESLDHCTRRLIELHTKGLTLQKNLVDLQESMNISSSPEHSYLKIDYRAISSNAELKKLKERIEDCQIEQQKIENVFYRILTSCKYVNLNLMIPVLNKILEIFYEMKLLDILKIYCCLLSCSYDLIQKFCSLEIEYITKKEKIKSCEEFLKNSENSINTRKIFLLNIGTNDHFLNIIFQSFLENPDKSLLDLTDNSSRENWVMHIGPLILIHLWTVFIDKFKLTPHLERLINLPDLNLDNSLVDVCKNLLQDLTLAKWCSDKYSKVKLQTLFQLIQNHSPLYSIHKSLPLHSLSNEDIENFLMEWCSSRDLSGSMTTSCLVTFKAYSIIKTVLQIIGFGIEIDKSIAIWKNKSQTVKTSDKTSENFYENLNSEANICLTYEDLNKFISFYETQISCKWNDIKVSLENLQPIEYRIEILENLFSLLFLQHSNLSDEAGSDTSGEDDGDVDYNCGKLGLDIDKRLGELKSKQGSQQILKSALKISPSRSNKVLTFNENAEMIDHLSDISSVSGQISSRESNDVEDDKIEGGRQSQRRFSSTEERIQSFEMRRERLQSHNSCTASEPSSGSSISEFPHQGFVINALVMWDMLLLLKDVIVKTQAEKFSQSKKKSDISKSQIVCSIPRQSMDNNLNSLMKNVTDALWRIKVVCPKMREIGSIEVMADYVTGNLFTMSSPVPVYNIRYGKDKELNLDNVAYPSKRIYKDSKQPTIINILLSPPKSLLTLCLVNGNISLAQQVVDMYGIKDSDEKQELELITCLMELKPKFEAADKQSGKLKSEKYKKSNSQEFMHSLGMLARKGAAEISPANLINNLVTFTPPPAPPGIAKILKETDDGLVSSVSLSKVMVLVDMALTANVSENTANLLLEQVVARQDFQDHINVTSSQLVKNIHGYMPLIQNIISMSKRLHEVKTSLEKDSDKKPAIVPEFIDLLLPTSVTPQKLLFLYLPSTHNSIVDSLKAWSKILNAYSCTESLLLKCNDPKFGNDSRIILSKNFKTLSMTVHEEKCKALQIKSKNQEKVGAYLRTFYAYLQMLTNMNFKLSKKLKPKSSHFDHLSERPMHIIGNLIFDEKVDPVRLGSIAQCLNLSLAAIIIQYCCPVFAQPSLRIEYCNDDLLNQIGCIRNDQCIIMNGGKMKCIDKRPGDITVRDLLASLLSRLREVIQSIQESLDDSVVALTPDNGSLAMEDNEIRTILGETSELGSVDIDQLEASEVLAFFINLSNLMMIHASLINHLLYPPKRHPRGIHSSHPFEVCLIMKKTGYLVGNLGFISMYDLLYGVLQQKSLLSSVTQVTPELCYLDLPHNSILDSNPIHKNYDFVKNVSLPQAIPSSFVFLLTQGNFFSPKVQVVYADRIEEQIETELQSHVDYYISYSQDLNNEDCDTVYLSKVMVGYLQSYDADWVLGIRQLKKYFNFEMRDILNFLDNSLCIGKEIKIKSDKDVGFHRIMLENLNEFSNSSTKSKSIKAQSAKNESQSYSQNIHPWFSVKIPTKVYEYLDRECPALATIVASLQDYNNIYKNVINLHSEDEIEPITYTSAWFLKRETMMPLKQLISLPRSKLLSPAYHNNEVIAALIYRPDLLNFWKFVDKATEVSQNLEGETNTYVLNQALDLHRFMSGLLTITLHQHAELEFLYHQLKMFLSLNSSKIGKVN